MESHEIPEATAAVGHADGPPSQLMLVGERAASKTPVETKRHEPSVAPVSRASLSFRQDKEGDLSRGVSIDDYQSLSGSVSTAFSSPPATPSTTATSFYFDDPQLLYDVGDVAPLRISSYPIKGVPGRAPGRSDSIDSDVSLAAQVVPQRSWRKVKHTTFPFHPRPPQRQPGQDVPYAQTTLRTASFPGPPSPILERDSGLGEEDLDEPYEADGAVGPAESVNTFPQDRQRTPRESIFSADMDNDDRLASPPGCCPTLLALS